MSDSMLYKERYQFYKAKCERLERVLGRFRELLDAEPEQNFTPENSPSTPPVMSQQQQESPILCRGVKVKRKLFKKSVEEEASKEVRVKVEEEEEDEDYLNFELGSNKWECVDLPEPSSPELTPPLERLKRIKKYSGLELSVSTVSKKIKGVARRELPGRHCDKCVEYYEANGFGPEIMDKLSRHRCIHQKPPSPKDFWSLDMSQYNKHDKYKRKQPE